MKKLFLSLAFFLNLLALNPLKAQEGLPSPIAKQGLQIAGMCQLGFGGGWISGQSLEEEDWCNGKNLQGFQSALGHPIGIKVPLIGDKLPGESTVETLLYDADKDGNITCKDLKVYIKTRKSLVDHGKLKRDGSTFQVKGCE